MGSSKKANFVTGAIGGESFKTTKLYPDAKSDKPDRSFAQPSPEAKKVELSREATSASEKAESLKDNEVVIKDKDKTPFVSKSNKNKDKVSKKIKAKRLVVGEEEEVEGEEESEEGVVE